jgi:hypothetical protein
LRVGGHVRQVVADFARRNAKNGVRIQWRTERRVWGVQPPPPPKFLSFAKAEPHSQFRGIYIRDNLIRIWVSLIF